MNAVIAHMVVAGFHAFSASCLNIPYAEGPAISVVRGVVYFNSHCHVTRLPAHPASGPAVPFEWLPPK